MKIFSLWFWYTAFLLNRNVNIQWKNIETQKKRLNSWKFVFDSLAELSIDFSLFRFDIEEKSSSSIIRNNYIDNCESAPPRRWAFFSTIFYTIWWPWTIDAIHHCSGVPIMRASHRKKNSEDLHKDAKKI